jgi:PAS domain S-box-containing protein
MGDAGAANRRALDAAAIADSAPVLLAVVDRAANLLWANRFWSEFTGARTEDLLAAAWLDWLHPGDGARIRDVLATVERFELDLRIRTRDGHTRWVAVRGAAREDGDVTISGVDVTASRQIERGLQLLAAVGEELNTSLATDKFLDGVARVLIADLADFCSIAVIGDDGRLCRSAVAHRDKEVEYELHRTQRDPIDPDGPSAIAQVVRAGTVLYRPIVDAPGPDEPWPSVETTRHPDELRSLICTPLRTRHGVIGALTVVSSSGHYQPDDVELVQEIAQRCAAAVENAALYRRSEEARERLALVASVGEQLASHADKEAMVDALLRRIVPVFADVAVIALVDDAGRHLERKGMCHVEPEREREFRAGPFNEPIPLGGTDPPARAARTGRPVLIEEYGPRDRSRTRGRAPSFNQASRLFLPTSLLAVPLVSGSRVLGVLTLGITSSSRRYNASDLPLALDLARRASLALERAHVLEEERRIAEALQHSMLPEALPEVPGLSLCARYLAGGRVDVGGDWYDVIPLAGARYGIAIGDVAGHGVRAATVMGQLRNALRAFASDGRDPGDVVARLNRFVFEQGPFDMATLLYGVLDPMNGRLDLATAAHLPPLYVRANGEIELLDVAGAPPIGAEPLTRYATSHFELERGSTLLLYTDGLVERRTESLDAGLLRLVEEARYAPALLDRLCDHLIDRLLDGARPNDDVAMLGLRYVGPTRGHFRVRRPARAAELAPVRRMLSAWLESAGFGNEEIGSIAVATTEAATNAIEHAYGPTEGWFEVEARIDHRGAVQITVRDGGRWRSKTRGDGGRGLTLIGRLMDDFEIRRRPTGTEIWMQRQSRGEEPLT